jgi:hypothetical protein
MKKSKITFIDWIGDGSDEFWDKLTDGEMEYDDYEDLKEKEQKKIKKALVDYLIEKRIYFNGSWHQNAGNCIPLIEYKGKLYYIAVTQRRWGDIMAMAWAVINGKKYQSMSEFWKDVEREKKGKKKKWKEGEYYNYLDFAWSKPEGFESPEEEEDENGNRKKENQCRS